MYLSDCVSYDVAPDRILEGFIEGDARIAFTSVQNQVEGDSGTVIPFLPVLQSVSPETLKL